MIDYLVKLGDAEIDDNRYILPGSYNCFLAAKENQWEDAAGGNHGEAYARKELTDPTRIVTSTVKVKGGKLAMASVKTANDIPKGKIFDCVKAIQDIELTAPVVIGQVVLADVCGTGVDIVATKNVPAKG